MGKSAGGDSKVRRREYPPNVTGAANVAEQRSEKFDTFQSATGTGRSDIASSLKRITPSDDLFKY
jgi:hypothetical protein